MNISAYSVLTSLFWFNLFVVLFYGLRKKWGVLGGLFGYHPLPLMMVIGLCVFRLFAPIETRYTAVLQSYHVFPWIQTFLQTHLFSFASVGLTVGALIIAFFTLISMALLLRLFRLLRREYKMIQQMPPSSDERLERLFQAVKAEAPSKRSCDLILSARHAEPFICSFRRSVIVIPVCALRLSDQDLQFILKHEWQHHLDRDGQLKIWIGMLCCLLWWNPFTYILSRNVSQTLELKCDRRVGKSLDAAAQLDYMLSLMRVMRLCCEQSASRPTDKTQSLASIRYLGISLPKTSGIDQDIMQRFDTATAKKSGKRTTSMFCLLVVLLALFILSFAFVVQPAFVPPAEGLYLEPNENAEVQMVSITPENAYLVDNTDETYSLYIDEKFSRIIGIEEASNKPCILLPIKTTSS